MPAAAPVLHEITRAGSSRNWGRHHLGIGGRDHSVTGGAFIQELGGAFVRNLQVTVDETGHAFMDVDEARAEALGGAFET